MQNKHFLLFITVAAVLLTAERSAYAQTPLTDTNLQIFYDFGKDRKFVTTTLEMYHPDAWGSTFFFVDIDYNFKSGDGNKNVGPSGAYLEIARCLNFWHESAVKDLSLQIEYNGGLGALGGGYTINHAFLAGPNYCFHSSDFRNTLNLMVLYKKFINLEQSVPLQFTAVWGLQDLFGAKGLRFAGFADVWWEGDDAIFITEPQLWYSVGQFFSCPNLNIGTEFEISNNFAGVQGWKCRPCLGLKWTF